MSGKEQASIPGKIIPLPGEEGSVSEVLANLHTHSADIDSVFIVCHGTDGSIDVYYSSVNPLKALGYLELVKQHFIEYLRGLSNG